MLKYYLKTAWRNLKVNKLFSALNIAGLAIGIAICIPLFSFVMNELSFDKMYKNKEDIYRVNLQSIPGIYTTASEEWAAVPNAVAPTIAKTIPEVKYAARMLKNNFGGPASLKVGENTFVENGLYWCDPGILKIFDIPFVYGDPATALSRPNTVVISQAEAERLFGKENAMGKIISIDNTFQMEVTGVYKTLPNNSTIDCAMMATFLSSHFSKNESWSNASFETYCLLNKNADVSIVNKKMNAILNESVSKDDRWFNLLLQPLSKVHLYSEGISGSYSSHNGDIKEVRNLALLGLLILFIACINYMNLATARSEKRSKEVGINKTLGASRREMIKRFYIETATIAFFAIVLGYVLSFGSIHLFNYITGKQLALTVLFSPEILGGILLLWLIVTIVAGSYPALVLSAFSPLLLMQKKVSKNLFDIIFRKGLVVLQFTCSVILIVAVMVVARQMKFIGKKDLGFRPDGVVSISLSGIENHKQLDALKNNLKNVSGVLDVAATQSVPGSGTSGRTLYKTQSDKSGMNLSTCHADAHIVNTLALKLIAGSSLPENISKADTTIYTILNKKAIDYLGYTPQQAIGKEIITMGFHTKVIITGVVADFNYESLRKPIGAYLYYAGNNAPEPWNALLVKFGTGNISQIMQQLAHAFKHTVPNAAFNYKFLDNTLAAMYASEQVTTKVAMLFSALAIFISCLGLFGLAAFTAEQRTKEVGIRKVLGASIWSITSLLSKDFIKLVLLSIVVALPIAGWVMNSWLNNFAYRIHISWMVMLLAAIVAIVIALITVSFQAIKSARANPVKSLKTE